MNELFSIITELLHTEACVVVPDFGGFVANHKSASVDAATGLCCPPSVQIVFNQKLSHNDGLLLQAWAARKNCSLAEAAQQVKAEVEDLKSAIASKHTLFISDFGTFSVKGSTYSFVSSLNQKGFGENFGLQQFYLPTLKSEASSSSKVRKYVAAGVAAAAVASVLFFPISTSVTNSFASFLPVSQETFSAENTLNFAAMSASQADACVRMQQPANVQAGVQTGNEDGRYYVVLQQFASESDASAFVGKWQPKLSDELSVVKVSNTEYVVACAYTANSNLAVKMMDNVRNNSSFKGAFILYK